jgi:transposase
MGYSLDPLPRSGRPRKLTPRKRRHLGQLVLQNKYSTAPELKNTLNKLHPNLNVSSSTVLNELHKLKYRCTVPKTILLLTAIHKQRRVEWAIKYQD